MSLRDLIQEEVAYLIYYAVPYALDLDILGVLYGTFEIETAGKFPYVEPIDLRQLSRPKQALVIVLMVAPYIDQELLKLLRLNRIGALNVVTKKAAKAGAKIEEHEAGKTAKKYAKRKAEESKQEARQGRNSGKLVADGEENRKSGNGRSNYGRPANEGGRGRYSGEDNGQDWRGNAASKYDDIEYKHENKLERVGDRLWSAGSFVAGLVLNPKLLMVFLIIGIPVFLLVGTGIGGGYGGLAADVVGPVVPDFGGVFSGIGESLSQVAGTVACFGDAGCLREMGLNQTYQRPGSEDVGETYELKVNGPRVFGDNTVDISNMRKNSAVPVEFTIKNTRNGIKGIDARNVHYKVLVGDPSLLGTRKARCKTDWIELDKYGGASSGDRSNDILPGESVSPFNYGGDKRLTLKECGLLQPGPSTTVTFVLQVKYDYSAMSFLDLQVMSQEHKNSNDISVTVNKRSKTPDTPVETFIKADNPATFSIIKDGEGNEQKRIPKPIRTEVGISTDEDNIYYKVNGEAFRFHDSDLTDHISGNCKGLSPAGDNTYKLAENIRKQIKNQKDKFGWFTKDTQPKTAYCNFNLNNVDEISPTGETITFSATTNYTVLQEEKQKSFTVDNTLCMSENCPMLEPLDASELNDKTATKDIDDMSFDPEKKSSRMDYWAKKYAYCGRPQDGQDGCSVVDSFSLNDRFSPMDVKIDDGELALKITSDMFSKGNTLFTGYAKNNLQTPNVTGVTQDELGEAYSSSSKAFNVTENGLEVTEVEKSG
ncbi:MAG: hypothetical protein ABEJ95_06255 [Candidatus Nanohalobium sp.]